MDTQEFFPPDAKNDPPEKSGKGWSIQHSWFSQYETDFKRADQKEWLPTIFAWVAKQETPVIVDLFSENHALRDFKRRFAPTKQLHAASLSLAPAEFPVQTPEDTATGIYHLSGDIKDKKTWEEFKGWLGKKRVHLWMERGHGALQYIPTEEKFQRELLYQIYDVLDPNGGTAILQTPSYDDLKKRGVRIDEWLHMLDEEKIPYQFCKKYFDNEPKPPFFGMLIIQKTPNHPVLPGTIPPGT